MSATRSLKRKHALVSGATSPLARAVAVALAEAGATVSLTTLEATLQDEVAANSILNECWSAGSQDGQVKTLDLHDVAAVEAAVNDLESAIAPIDILVNVTHGAAALPVIESTLEDWTRTLDRHATTAFVPILAVGRRMVQRGAGRIISIVSSVHRQSDAGQAFYAASQGAVIALTRTLAVEWGLTEDPGPGLTINAIEVELSPDGGVPGGLREALVSLAADDARTSNGELVTAGSVENPA